MAMIEKLSICGIRSFGAESEEVMEFQRPLTLLVGPNGAGKTTIIECLKYVTIGKKPCIKNEDFIHDPKLTETKQVSANVKLRCRDVDGARLEVERHVTAEQRGKKVQTRITDGVINRHGRPLVSYRRSADLDLEMVTSLGVSEAVLNHVVFCHQEDSTWPLGTGKTVKEKFDEIFAATRYMKALEEIRNIEKSQKIEVDREKAKLEFFVNNRDKSIEIANKLKEAEKEAKEEMMSLQKISDDIGPIEIKLRELRAKNDDVSRTEEELTSLKAREQEKTTHRNQLQSGIKQEIKKSRYELKQIQDKALNTLKRKEESRNLCENELESHGQKIDKIHSTFNTISAMRGRLEQEQKQAANIKRDRDEKIKSYAQEHNISIPDSNISEDEASLFENQFNSFAEKYIKELEAEKTKIETKLKSREQDFLAQSHEAVRLEEGIAQKKSNLQEYEKNLEKVKKDLECIKSSEHATDLEAASHKFEKAKNDLAETEARNSVDEEERRLLYLEVERSDLKEKILSQEDVLSKAIESIAVRSKLEFLSKYLKKKEQSLDNTKRKLQASSSSRPGFNLHSMKYEQLTSWMLEKDREIDSVRMELIQTSEKLLEEKLRRLCTEERAARSFVVYALQKEDIEIIKNEIEDLRRGLPDPTKSLDSILRERKSLQEEYDNVEEALQKTRDSIAKFKESIFQQKENLLTAWELKLKLSQEMDSYSRLINEEESLKRSISSLSSRIGESQRTLPTLETKVKELETLKEAAAEERDVISKKLNSEEKQLKLKQENLTSLVLNVKVFLKKQLHRKLKELEGSELKYKQSLESSTTRKQELENEIKSLNKDIANFDVDKRNVEDNLNLCEISKEIEEIKAEIKRKENQLKKRNPDSIAGEIANLETKWHQLNNQHQRGNERKLHQRERLNELKSELDRREYKFADENYKECLIKSTLLSMASEDLEKYYKALDKAILKYHKIKMDEINKTMKELWQETYSGKDIDYIQIVSSGDTGPSKRRVFNYRVVMFSDGVEMDMRGRCSAGQKVLTSIIIRLALAQQFCRNCGVLALDEPTTNLDKENIANLAQSLINIIDLRSDQRNFQLLVITHDENFVDLLGKSRYVDHYFRVRKKNSHSHITRCLISRIFEHDDESDDDRPGDDQNNDDVRNIAENIDKNYALK
ncbi:DNA repair protein RAD50-like isoform X2 [Clavelina lepadiformis]|uniref:DNA repair protein RAD50-like isoform X2 n=1 Tax=Clavelina lepadiformis TaxID=159417 RepID=UPI00404251DF